MKPEDREVAWALRALAANILRVVRGAGEPQAILRHYAALVEALERYHDTKGVLPDTAFIHEALSVRQDYEGEDAMGRKAIDLMIQGGLQIAASRLMKQPLQIAQGEAEMLAGIKTRAAYFAEKRRQ